MQARATQEYVDYLPPTDQYPASTAKGIRALLRSRVPALPLRKGQFSERLCVSLMQTLYELLFGVIG